MLEFDLLNFVNFEADIHFAEDEGIVQVDTPHVICTTSPTKSTLRFVQDVLPIGVDSSHYT